MSALGRRQRQWANGHNHLARICGKSVKGGRPIYPRRKRTVAEAIAAERALAAKMQAMKGRKKTK